MGATYTRQSTYTDGDTITANHTNDEFDQLLAAFAASTGHTHDGTAGEGGPISTMGGHAITFGSGTAGTDIVITFDGETNDGVLKWMEDEDYFEFSDDLLIATTEKIQFRDTGLYINSSTDGQLDIVADTEVQIAATTIDINGNTDVSGNLSVGGNLDVTGSFDMSDANITNIGSIALDTITNDGTDITLDSSGDIILDAGGANVTIKDDGTSILDIANNSSDVELTVSVADKHFKIKGTDDSSAITALDIDMALAGKATFNGDVVIGGDLTITGDDLVMGTNTAGHILVADGTNFNPTAVGDLASISTVANEDVFLAVDDTDGVLKKITRSAIVSGLATSGAISNVADDTTPQLGGDLDGQKNNLHNIGVFSASYGSSSAPTTVVVKVATKTTSHPYYDDGSTSAYFLDDIEAPALTLHGVDNVTSDSGYYYKFDQADSSNSGHPLRFYLDADKTTAYTTGVTTSGTPGNAGAYTQIDVDEDTPSILYYQCSSHDLMGNYANVQGSNVINHSEALISFPATTTTLIGTNTTDTLTNKTLTSPVINTGTFGTSILPVSADGTTLGSAAKEFSDLFLADGGTIQFGNDQEIILTHVADNGLTLKHIGTGDGKMPTFTFQAGDNDIAANDELGVINFQAPDEGAGTDAILVAAGIAAVSEGDFSASNNATKLSFRTGASEAASEKMSLSSAGLLTISDDFIIKDGGTIGSASDADAITIASDGVVTFSQVPVLPNNTIETADIQADAITGAKIADDAINSEHYTDGSIDTAHIADANITTAKIADANVTQGKIANEAINEAKLQVSNAPTNGYFLTAQSGNTGGLTWAELSGIPTYTRSTTPPGSPSAGDWWYNYSTNLLYIYDGTDGWITDSDGEGGRGFFLAGNTFSLVLQGNSSGTSSGFQESAHIYSVRFESEAQMLQDKTPRENHFFDGNGHMSSGGPTAVSDTNRVVFTNNNTTVTDALMYLTMLTGGTASAFGNAYGGQHSRSTGISNATRGLFAGGAYTAFSSQIDYITIQSTGNAADFGDLTLARLEAGHDCIANTTRGVVCGGLNSSSVAQNVMDYVTIATTGNATDFGNMINAQNHVATAHSITRGIIFGGESNINVIDYITIATTGNASDFGDMTNTANQHLGFCVHNKLYAYHNRKSSHSKTTIATLGSAEVFEWTSLGSLGSNEDNGVGKGWIAASG